MNQISQLSKEKVNDDPNYIFNDKDFEDDNFHPAQFVARYRRVAPLDSLKDQLRSYSLNIKNQLYEIINRDYKNFIKIATKVSEIIFIFFVFLKVITFKLLTIKI